MSRVKVTEIKGAFAFEGKSYGPFQASKDTPFIEVPEALASALNLPLHEDEVKAREAEQAEQQASDAFDPVSAIQRVNAELPELSEELTRQLAPIVAALNEALKASTEAVNASTATLQPSPKSPEQGDTATPLVDGLQHADLLMAAGITSMEALEAGLIVPEGEKVSPVEAVDGIGKKTVEAYTKAVADWRKGQGQQ